MRRWWNRLLVRLHLVHPTWYRATYDANTGWHESYRLRKGADNQAPATDDWVSTHRWHDDHPTDIMDQAAFHIWPADDGWTFGPTPEDAAISVDVTDDTGDSDLDIRASIAAADWAVRGAATWPSALSDAQIQEANVAMADVAAAYRDLQTPDAISAAIRAAAARGEWTPDSDRGRYLETPDAAAEAREAIDGWHQALPDRGRYLELPDETLMGGGLDGYPLSDQRVLPDDSRGILVTDLQEGDGPHVPANMPTDQIPLPQDFNYPAPAIDMDDDR